MPPQITPPGRNRGGPAARFGTEKVKPKDMKKAIGRLLGYIGKDKPKVALAVICVLISTGTNLAGTYMQRPL